MRAYEVDWHARRFRHAAELRPPDTTRASILMIDIVWRVYLLYSYLFMRKFVMKGKLLRRDFACGSCL